MSVNTTVHNVTGIRILEAQHLSPLAGWMQDIQITHECFGREETTTFTLFAADAESLADPDITAFEAEDVRSIMEKAA